MQEANPMTIYRHLQIHIYIYIYIYSYVLYMYSQMIFPLYPHNCWLYSDYLVGGFKHLDYFPSYMGCHPSHWLIFFKMGFEPPTRYYMVNLSSTLTNSIDDISSCSLKLFPYCWWNIPMISPLVASWNNALDFMVVFRGVTWSAHFPWGYEWITNG